MVATGGGRVRLRRGCGDGDGGDKWDGVVGGCAVAAAGGGGAGCGTGGNLDDGQDQSQYVQERLTYRMCGSVDEAATCKLVSMSKKGLPFAHALIVLSVLHNVAILSLRTRVLCRWGAAMFLHLHSMSQCFPRRVASI